MYKRLVIVILVFSTMILIVLPSLLVSDRYIPQNQSYTLTSDGTVGDLLINVYVDKDKKLIQIPLEEYVKGVVAAEMPALFHEEALKAQAILARTYALKRMRIFGGNGCDYHPEADVCTDPAVSQAWLSEEDLREKWGFIGYYRYWRKIDKAVEDTRGLMVIYDGVPIDAVYHSSAGGVTEAALYVWGNDVPYLRSVESPWDEDGNKYEETVSFSLQEFAARLDISVTSLSVALERRQPIMKVLEYSPSGRILRILVLDKELSGREFRSKLALNSTMFTWNIRDGRVYFTTLGNGHGAGMSQYGANGLAEEGKTYEEIIKHYYYGVEIKPIFRE